jgi:hypothetical protein
LQILAEIFRDTGLLMQWYMKMPFSVSDAWYAQHEAELELIATWVHEIRKEVEILARRK